MSHNAPVPRDDSPRDDTSRVTSTLGKHPPRQLPTFEPILLDDARARASVEEWRTFVILLEPQVLRKFSGLVHTYMLLQHFPSFFLSMGSRKPIGSVPCCLARHAVRMPMRFKPKRCVTHWSTLLLIQPRPGHKAWGCADKHTWLHLH